MFIKVRKTLYLFIHGSIRIHTWPDGWYNYSYSAEYSQSLFGTALVVIHPLPHCQVPITLSASLTCQLFQLLTRQTSYFGYLKQQLLDLNFIKVKEI